MKILIAIRKFLRFLKPRSFNILSRKKAYILQLPPELLQEIMSLIWASASNESEQINLMNCLPLVCKAIAMAFYQVSPQDIKFTSQGFYEYYISHISKFNSSHPANTRLTVTGLFHKIEIARVWESLFEVEELVVDGKVLPVGKDAPWALNMTQACEMLNLRCRGTGWNWMKRRPYHPTDLTIFEEYELGNLWPLARPPQPFKPPVKHAHRGLLDPEDSFKRIRHSKSFSYMQDSSTRDIEQMNCRIVIKRTKTIAELPMIDFPYDGTE
ncbi:hypothetical protein Clacol_008926 [Clathrus columnatus]|uniref:F-box domain-containing protein n=1 Tax=Clathrus columnatus TaxID=1419009 RepID=A0AAV5APA4_9AGAM|nr:hypothetical protein Clacol_008926 [Clathrus columnatus]